MLLSRLFFYEKFRSLNNYALICRLNGEKHKKKHKYDQRPALINIVPGDPEHDPTAGQIDQIHNNNRKQRDRQQKPALPYSFHASEYFEVHIQTPHISHAARSDKAEAVEKIG